MLADHEGGGARLKHGREVASGEALRRELWRSPDVVLTLKRWWRRALTENSEDVYDGKGVYRGVSSDMGLLSRAGWERVVCRVLYNLLDQYVPDEALEVAGELWAFIGAHSYISFCRCHGSASCKACAGFYNAFFHLLWRLTPADDGNSVFVGFVQFSVAAHGEDVEHATDRQRKRLEARSRRRSSVMMFNPPPPQQAQAAPRLSRRSIVPQGPLLEEPPPRVLRRPSVALPPPVATAEPPCEPKPQAPERPARRRSSVRAVAPRKSSATSLLPVAEVEPAKPPTPPPRPEELESLSRFRPRRGAERLGRYAAMRDLERDANLPLWRAPSAHGGALQAPRNPLFRSRRGGIAGEQGADESVLAFRKYMGMVEEESAAREAPAAPPAAVVRPKPRPAVAQPRAKPRPRPSTTPARPTGLPKHVAKLYARRRAAALESAAAADRPVPTLSVNTPRLDGVGQAQGAQRSGRSGGAPKHSRARQQATSGAGRAFAAAAAQPAQAGGFRTQAAPVILPGEGESDNEPSEVVFLAVGDLTTVTARSPSPPRAVAEESSVWRLDSQPSTTVRAVVTRGGRRVRRAAAAAGSAGSTHAHALWHAAAAYSTAAPRAATASGYGYAAAMVEASADFSEWPFAPSLEPSGNLLPWGTGRRNARHRARTSGSSSESGSESGSDSDDEGGAAGGSVAARAGLAASRALPPGAIAASGDWEYDGTMDSGWSRPTSSYAARAPLPPLPPPPSAARAAATHTAPTGGAPTAVRPASPLFPRSRSPSSPRRSVATHCQFEGESLTPQGLQAPRQTGFGDDPMANVAVWLESSFILGDEPKPDRAATAPSCSTRAATARARSPPSRAGSPPVQRARPRKRLRNVWTQVDLPLAAPAPIVAADAAEARAARPTTAAAATARPTTAAAALRGGEVPEPQSQPKRLLEDALQIAALASDGAHRADGSEVAESPPAAAPPPPAELPPRPMTVASPIAIARGSDVASAAEEGVVGVAAVVGVANTSALVAAAQKIPGRSVFALRQAIRG